MTYVSSDAPPFSVIHGEKDNQVLLEQSEELYQKPVSAGKSDSSEKLWPRVYPYRQSHQYEKIARIFKSDRSYLLKFRPKKLCLTIYTLIGGCRSKGCREVLAGI